MIEAIRLLTRNARSFGISSNQAELEAVRECMQKALHVLERTLQSMDCEVREPFPGPPVDRD